MYTETEEEERTNPSEQELPLFAWHSALDLGGCLTGLLVAQPVLCTGFASREGSASPRCRRRRMAPEAGPCPPDKVEWEDVLAPAKAPSHTVIFSISAQGHRERWSVGEDCLAAIARRPLRAVGGSEASGSFTPPRRHSSIPALLNRLTLARCCSVGPAGA